MQHLSPTGKMRDFHHHLLLFLYLFLLSLYQASIASSLSTAPKAAHHRCRDDQRSAFAQLQENLKFPLSSSKAELWDLKTDCCSWEGVTCNDVGRATRLDLISAYDEYGDSISLKKPNLGMLFQNLSFLVELNLDYVNISAQGSNWCEVISHVLPNLRVLSLSSSGISGPLCSSLSKLHFLSELHLDSNSELSSIPPSFLANSSNLETLDLSNCGLNGSFPNNIFLLPKLQHIDLSENLLLSGQFPEFSLNSSIQSLLLKNTNFSGNIPLSISNLKSLKELDLGMCKFYGVIPPSLANLTQLETLDLSFNSFNGSIPPFQRDGVANLSFLFLEHNQLNGILYSSLFTLPSLQQLDLSSNQLSGKLDEFSDASSSLLTIELSNNNLSGSIPRSIFNLPSLIELDLQNNKFSGPLKLGDFKNQRDLVYLALSDVSVESDNSSLAYVQLATLYLPSCNLTEFPNFLKTQNSLTVLDLSNNRIQGYVPSWIWKTTLSTLYLSRNPVDFPKIPPFVKVNHSTPTYNEDGVSSFPMTLENLGMSSCNVTGSFPEFIKNQEKLVYLDLSDNKLGGQIPKWIWNMSLTYLNLSCNNFDFLDQFSNPISLPYSDTLITLDLHANQLPGSFPKAICNCSQLSLLDMSHNHLRSQIPDCLGKVPTLTVLNLQGNNFDSISSYAIASNLLSLKISDNKVEGKLPRSLANCSKLEVLDLGGNMIRDTFPVWLDKLPALKILVLQANKFYGPIGNRGTATTWPMLHVMDLSSNEFTGNLLKEFVQSLVGMQLTSNNESRARYVGDNYHINGYYKESVTITNKGRKMRMDRIITLFTCLDLSNNSFHGEIPEEIRILKSLIVLTLSHNNFLGQIPSSLSDLTELESLDLSSNHLSGEIPPQLSRLTFLAVMNLSYNHLEGRIPQGNQFLTFPSSSYEGNPRLCGPPLTRKCNPEVNEPATPPADHEDSWTEYILDWKIMGIGYASGIVIGFSVGYTILSEMRIKWFTDLIRLAGNKERWFNQGQRGLQSW
ncbi:receptor-like protein 49 isoform X11 [Populus trichocarpa]|uniref:receptor-like protein 49 isoform X11 n=1 Tax=Populus trichocarpa TaxID=3694 RepID=UPI00227976DD|nr:receptor-like protein 49 isoform X11 [Populus trichocarpa]